jgi:polysaccharide pyruvyl transferase WcaK-like protein
VVDWLKAFRTLKGTTMLVMTGTGMLSDFGIGPLDLHYEILKWAILAKVRGCKVLFVSVGVGPLAHSLSRWIVKRALSLADYRSYRDTFSRQYLESIGFNASADRVYPDLAFSLVSSQTPVGPGGDRDSRLIGLGLMDYYGQHPSPQERERVYQRYVERVTRFAVWLLQRGYSLRLLIGDVSYDKRVKGDLRRLLERTGVTFDAGRIIDEPVSSTEQLCAQLARTDMVVATRFHNVLLALLLNRPVIALAPHEKVRSLMAGVGLADFSQDAAELDVDLLIEQFERLRDSAAILKAPLKEKMDGFRRALDEQYRYVFGDLLSAAAGPATPRGPGVWASSGVNTNSIGDPSNREVT